MNYRAPDVLTTATRPDLQYAVNTLCQFLSDPRDVHLQAAKHALRYLRSTLEYRLSYAKGSSKSKLTGYADSAYANASKGTIYEQLPIFPIKGRLPCHVV